MKERVLFIDMTKGIAMIAIVMLHLCGNLQGESARLISFFNHSWDTRLFFFVSGMVAALGGANMCRIGDVLSFFKKKTIALFFPYLIWTTILFPYVYKHSSIESYSEILVNAFLPPMGGYWFLLYLYVIHLMFGCMKYLSEIMNLIWGKKMYCEIMASVILSIPLFLIYEYTVCFFFGFFLYGYGKSVLFNKYFQLFSFITFIIMFTIFKETHKLHYLSQFIIAISASVTIVGITKNLQVAGLITNKIGSSICYLGRKSFEIYLIHYFFVWFFEGYRLPVDNIHAIPLYITILGVALFICYLCCFVASALKQIPYLSLLFFGNRQ